MLVVDDRFDEDLSVFVIVTASIDMHLATTLELCNKIVFENTWRKSANVIQYSVPTIAPNSKFGT